MLAKILFVAAIQAAFMSSASWILHNLLAHFSGTKNVLKTFKSLVSF